MLSIYENDTIAALATPPGQGGIAIVRVSGEAARTCFDALFVPAGKQIPGRTWRNSTSTAASRWRGRH